MIRARYCAFISTKYIHLYSPSLLSTDRRNGKFAEVNSDRLELFDEVSTIFRITFWEKKLPRYQKSSNRVKNWQSTIWNQKIDSSAVDTDVNNLQNGQITHANQKSRNKTKSVHVFFSTGCVSGFHLRRFPPPDSIMATRTKMFMIFMYKPIILRRKNHTVLSSSCWVTLAPPPVKTDRAVRVQ